MHEGCENSACQRRRTVSCHYHQDTSDQSTKAIHLKKCVGPLLTTLRDNFALVWFEVCQFLVYARQARESSSPRMVSSLVGFGRTCPTYLPPSQGLPPPTRPVSSIACFNKLLDLVSAALYTLRQVTIHLYGRFIT